MIKSSSFGFEFKESRGRWDCGKENRSEWTYEGRRKILCAGRRQDLVETDGSSACYKGSAYRKLYAEEKENFYFPGGIAKAALLSRAWAKAFFYL